MVGMQSNMGFDSELELESLVCKNFRAMIIGWLFFFW